MKLKEVSHEITNQLKTVLKEISQQTYSDKIGLLSSSSLGQHVRHVIECFNCFLAGYEDGLVDYDIRPRDKNIETNTFTAVIALLRIETQLLDVKLDKKLELKVSFGSDENSVTFIETTAGRELAYNIEHAIHHMALIKIGLNSICPELILPENFGIAYSTIKHHEQVCAQ